MMIEVNPSTECWIWKRSGRNGYGQIRVKSVLMQAHVFFYKQFIGEVPDGFVVHHKCNNRGCVNPDHLEVRTQQSNILEGNSMSAFHATQTHCSYGHEFSPENTYITSSGARRCKLCNARLKQDSRKRAKIREELCLT